MIIKALNTFGGILDLSALERLQESNPIEKYPFRLYIRPNESVEVDDKYYYLTSVQNALRLGYIQIGNFPKIPQLNSTLIDFTYNGTTMTQIAGEDLVMGDVVYYGEDGRAYKAKADSLDTMICIGIVAANASVGNSVTLLIEGLIRNSSKFNFTVGGQAGKTKAIVYVSSFIAGGVAQTHEFDPNYDYILQIIGYAVSKDILSFKPDYTYIEVEFISSSSSSSSSSLDVNTVIDNGEFVVDNGEYVIDS